MLLYGGRQRADEGDFVSLSLVNRRLQLRFNLGNGLALITCVCLSLSLFVSKQLYVITTARTTRSGGTITSRQPCVSCTGCQSANKWIQDIHPCLSFVGWHRSCVPSWRLYAGYRRWPPSSVVCWQSNVLGQEITQPVRWPLFCHRRANAVEQSAWTASTTGHQLRTIQTIV